YFKPFLLTWRHSKKTSSDRHLLTKSQEVERSAMSQLTREYPPNILRIIIRDYMIIFSLTILKQIEAEWKKADKDGSGTLSLKEIERLLGKLNVKMKSSVV